MQENPRTNDPRALQLSRIITKVTRHHCGDRRHGEGFVEAEQLLSRKFARCTKPEMNCAELMDLVVASGRYQVKVAHGGSKRENNGSGRRQKEKEKE